MANFSPKTCTAEVSVSRKQKKMYHEKSKILKVKSFSCDATEDGMRLDQFLTLKIEASTRSFIQRVISEQRVSINNNLITKNGYRLKMDDIISVSFPDQVLDTSKAYDLHLDVIAQQDDFLIINKPAGLLVHHAPSNKESISLVNGLLYLFKNFTAFDNNERPGIVHRLDKETSGLLIVAKNQTAQHTLSSSFKQRNVQKTYLALVEGHPEPQGQIDFAIGRHKTQRHKMSHNGMRSRSALTFYKVIEYYSAASLVEFYPVTGRTHQIRVHAAAINHPIIGDVVYGTSCLLIKRQALHASRLSFTYKGTKYDFHAPLPEDMQNLIKLLKGTQTEIAKGALLATKTDSYRSV